MRNRGKQMSKPILCVDFDGVLHSYTSGWQGAHICKDPPVPGAIDFLRRASEHFEIHIFSSRSGQEGGLSAMQGWLADHAFTGEQTPETMAWFYNVKWPTEKSAAMVTLDDRAITFTGAWPEMQDIINFKPWNKQADMGKVRVIPNIDAARYMRLEDKTINLMNVLREAKEVLKSLTDLGDVLTAHIATLEAYLPVKEYTDEKGRTEYRRIGDEQIPRSEMSR
jgi:hypothetical protein